MRRMPTESDRSASHQQPSHASRSSQPSRKKRLVRGAASALVPRPTTQQVEGRRGFSDCPREIRDMVYHHLWKDTPHMVVAWDAADNWKGIAGAEAVITAIYDSFPNDQNGSAKALPQWLLANKQILAEGLEQFQDYGVWCVSDPAEVSRDMSIQPLLHPSTAEDMIVNMNNLFSMYHLEGFPTNLTRQWATPKHESLDALYSLLLDNNGVKPKLKLLELRTTMRYLQLDYHPQLYEFFLDLQNACADEDIDDDDMNDDDDDECWFYPDDAPDLDDLLHDDYPLTGLDKDLFDLSYLSPPKKLCKSLQQFHVQGKLQEHDKTPPSAAQDLMHEGISALADTIFPRHKVTKGKVLNTDGAGGLYHGKRWEFRRGPFRPSRERERVGSWAPRKMTDCEFEYFPDCLYRHPNRWPPAMAAAFKSAVAAITGHGDSPAAVSASVYASAVKILMTLFEFGPHGWQCCVPVKDE